MAQVGTPRKAGIARRWKNLESDEKYRFDNGKAILFRKDEKEESSELIEHPTGCKFSIYFVYSQHFFLFHLHLKFFEFYLSQMGQPFL